LSSTNGIETEIKLKAPADPDSARQLLESNGFSQSEPRLFEGNDIYDTPDRAVKGRGELIRLRQAGTRSVLTWKGKSIPAIHKSRPEHEVIVSDFEEMRAILTGLGYQVTFRYEKYRTEFQDTRGKGTATLDETPVGIFFELEGPPEWIDEAASRLGYGPGDYVTASYAGLYLDYCREHRNAPTHMTFPAAS
jgi:adenylate cyclase class 2